MSANAQAILTMLNGLPRLKVLVVGDLMLDRYISGDVSRVSPEAPVPVLRHAQRVERPGGAANVAMNLAGLGAQSYLAGFWGSDAESTALSGLVKAAGIDTTGVVTTKRGTISKTRILGRNQQLMRLDVDPVEAPSDEELRELTERVAVLVPQMDAVVLSDYDKGTLTRSLCEAAIRAARAKGIPVLADPKSPDLSKYSDATTVCPNVQELALATGVAVNDMASIDMDELIRAGQGQVIEHGFEFMTLTMSEKGIRVLRARSNVHFPAKAREVYDVSGAGDTVIAMLAAALASKLDAETAVELANLAAAIVVSKRGAVPVYAKELAAQVTKSSTGSAEKILSLDALQQRVAAWRTEGEAIVFTNGCFDILHPGHIALLEQCRSFGDKVIVGVNTDASVRTLKGEGRPVTGEQARALVLAALASVDAVVLFDEETPLALIRTLAPDVLVKGGDYRVETVVGSADVLARGGRVEIVPMIEGYSTTGIVQKMAQ